MNLMPSYCYLKFLLFCRQLWLLCRAHFISNHFEEAHTHSCVSMLLLLYWRIRWHYIYSLLCSKQKEERMDEATPLKVDAKKGPTGTPSLLEMISPRRDLCVLCLAFFLQFVAYRYVHHHHQSVEHLIFHPICSALKKAEHFFFFFFLQSDLFSNK